MKVGYFPIKTEKEDIKLKLLSKTSLLDFFLSSRKDIFFIAFREQGGETGREREKH